MAPSLSERKDDIPLLVKSFLERSHNSRGKGGEKVSLTPEAEALMQQYSWPGNIRELENLIERLSVMEKGPELGPEVLPPEIANPDAQVMVRNQSSDEIFSIPEVERLTILKALRATGGNRRRSAELLNISIRTLRNKLNQYREASLLPDDLELDHLSGTRIAS